MSRRKRSLSRRWSPDGRAHSVVPSSAQMLTDGPFFDSPGSRRPARSLRDAYSPGYLLFFSPVGCLARRIVAVSWSCSAVSRGPLSQPHCGAMPSGKAGVGKRARDDSFNQDRTLRGLASGVGSFARAVTLCVGCDPWTSPRPLWGDRRPPAPLRHVRAMQTVSCRAIFGRGAFAMRGNGSSTCSAPGSFASCLVCVDGQSQRIQLWPRTRYFR